MRPPRENRWTWDDAFMSMAIDISRRSPDPDTQVGCCIVDDKNRVIGAGYNGIPRGINPDTIPWEREWKGDPGNTKYDWVIHAEENAILNTTASMEGAKCYVTLQPCNLCGMKIIQAGITEIVYLDDKYKDRWFTKLALDMFSRVDIVVRKHKWSEQYLSECANK